MAKIPQTSFALIGGSSTFSLNFPQEQEGVEILATGMVFPTPYGDSPPFTLFRYAGKDILTCKTHGWRPGVSRADASLQIFSVFKEAGVRRIISEGGVGSVNHLLDPRDIVIPSDYIDFSMRKDVSLGLGYLLVMRQAVCPDLHSLIYKAAQEAGRRVFPRGICAVTDGRHFESPAEINMLRQAGADTVGQSMCPEVYLAREIGACYARLDVVVNYAEGVVRDWAHEELKEIYHEDASQIGRIILKALAGIPAGRSCGCLGLRKETLLRGK